MVLCMNVSAGIGVIGIASPMIQEIFGGSLIGVAKAFNELTTSEKAQLATIGAGFAALLSVFNIFGRIGWASASDYLGRKRTYFIFFALGIALYSLAPFAGRTGSVTLFVVIFCIILTMYGGGFATIPAYLADLFGTQYVGAIHGRLLTAWSTAGVLGPVLVNYIREYQIDRGVPNAQAYNVTMYILAGLLVIGFICNLLVKPLDERHYMSHEELDAAQGKAPAMGQRA
jgi:MFS family permease